MPDKRKRKRRKPPAFEQRKLTKVEQFGLEEIVVRMKKDGKSYGEIAHFINESGLMPVDQTMTVPNLSRFMNHTMPEIKREIVKKDKRRMLKVANMQIDVIGEINALYDGAKAKLKENLNAKEYKAISSEMRELLKQILELQKEVLSYENVKKFMDIVLNTVREECPEALPTILERLRVHQNTGWFGEQQTEEQKQEG